MARITDEMMRAALPNAKNYTVFILKAGPNRYKPDVEKLIWEHSRRNFSLRAVGLLSIDCPIRDGSDITGVGVFNATLEEATQLMNDDPSVQAGVFIYELHASRSFPGDSLP
jgi:hypothetical protein